MERNLGNIYKNRPVILGIFPIDKRACCIYTYSIIPVICNLYEAKEFDDEKQTRNYPRHAYSCQEIPGSHARIARARNQPEQIGGCLRKQPPFFYLLEKSACAEWPP